MTARARLPECGSLRRGYLEKDEMGAPHPMGAVGQAKEWGDFTFRGHRLPSLYRDDYGAAKSLRNDFHVQLTSSFQKYPSFSTSKCSTFMEAHP